MADKMVDVIDFDQADWDPGLVIGKDRVPLRWYITQTAMDSMVSRCACFVSEEAANLKLHNGTFDRLVQEMRDILRDLPPQRPDPNDDSYLMRKVSGYCKTADHHFRVAYNEDGDACVFICVENHELGKMVVTTVLHYPAKSLKRDRKDSSGPSGGKRSKQAANQSLRAAR